MNKVLINNKALITLIGLIKHLIDAQNYKKKQKLYTKVTIEAHVFRTKVELRRYYLYDKLADSLSAFFVYVQIKIFSGAAMLFLEP